MIFYDTLILDHEGDERTAVRFSLDADDQVHDINTIQTSLIRALRGEDVK